MMKFSQNTHQKDKRNQMKITNINQEDKKLVQTTKTVDWLVNNTHVFVFDPVKFKGYQRDININHCSKIVKFLQNNFYLPTSIICACDEDFQENTQLRIVDGQHRIEAFKKLQESNPKRFEEIKNYEISVIVMEKVDINEEIDTFITINKTSKRVDTSLAFVLKNKINSKFASDNLNISKFDYISVEVAESMNQHSDYWSNSISFTGAANIRKSEFISLNSFVKATRRLISILDKKNIIDVSWENSDQVEECVKEVYEIINKLWENVVLKWPNLFKKNENYLKIIQGPIGYSSIIRFVSNEIKLQNNLTKDNLEIFIEEIINSISLKDEVWYPGNMFSKFTSESGYNIIVSNIKESMII